MTLTESRQLKERFLKFEDLRALDYCERRCLEEKRPGKRWEMFNFIERMLQELKANGVGYPKVLLLRKKEIQRREFAIHQPARLRHRFALALAAGCSVGRLCPKGEPHRAQLRKWGMKV